jgi:DNA-directed RNA polymerase subunit RPC12/RpoP
MTGVGMDYGSLMDVIDIIKNKSVKVQISEILKYHKVNEENFTHNIYICNKCGNLYERFFVKLNYDDNQIFETVFSCYKCRKPLFLVENEEVLEKMPCPKCKNKALHIDTSILWD